jgi:predicted phosphodiesterase
MAGRRWTRGEITELRVRFIAAVQEVGRRNAATHAARKHSRGFVPARRWLENHPIEWRKWERFALDAADPHAYTDAGLAYPLSAITETPNPPEPQDLDPNDPRFARLAQLLHPAPFEVCYPDVALPQESETIITGLIYGDTHGQFIDRAAEEVLLAVASRYQPQVVVHVGDGVDSYTISQFDKDPERKEDFQDEIDHGRRHLARVRHVVPDSTFFYLEGNHEDRLRRAIWKSDKAMRQIAKLRAFRGAITWPNLLQLGDLGIEWVGAREQSRKVIFPKFIVKHGTIVRKWSSWTAKGEWEKYGKSGASGHTHRLGTFFHRDHNGNHVWTETGCLCDLNPDYLVDPDWQNGFLVVTFEQSTGAFQMEPVYIHHGSAVWRGQRYLASGAHT